MYKNLEAELARKKVKKRYLAKILDCREATIYDKLNGKSPFYVEEIKKIRDELFPGFEIDYLVETENEDENF